jgi:TetR/AcrR family transcriptional repressor of nem operon
MTRYPKEHKAEIRQGIVAIAAAAMRRAGIDGARVSDIMRKAGLTHGGFYVHFTSKDDLVAEACAAGVVDARASLVDVARDAAPRDRVQACLDAYLTRQRRDAAGCTLATLAGEIARQPLHVRKRFTEELAESLEALAPLMPALDEERRLDQVLALVSSMVGAMLLSRAVADRKLSDRILDVSRRTVGGAVEWASGAGSRI